jgi:chromate transporter
LSHTEPPGRAVALGTIAREWTRIGVTGFGGPPTHMALLRRLVVERGWLTDQDVESAIAACNLLPGPASTQLAIYIARRLGGPAGAVVGGLGFVLPAVIFVTALSAVFLAQSPPTWILGAGAGAGAAVAAVAVRAGLDLLGPSWERASPQRGRRERWIVYALLGGAAAATVGPYLVLVLLACGGAELVIRRGTATGTRGTGRGTGRGSATGGRLRSVSPAPLLLLATASGGIGALAWVAFKVGALSYGGGFVIVPLMQADAVHTYHWMTSSAFLTAVALGQVTPGPVVSTVAAVGYAAHGVGGAALAAFIAFLPSFSFVLLGASHFDRLRANPRMQAFLDGAGPAAIGAILGSAIPLAGALKETWQFVLLAAASLALLVLRGRLVAVLFLAGAAGVVIGLAGGPLP